MKRLLTLLLATTMFTSCEPFTKEEYLDRYKKFIDEVSVNYKNYSADQWKNANEKYERFNNEWYNKFKHEFSFEEKMQITGYQLKYNGLKAAVEIGKFYDEHLKEDVDELRTKIKYYVENHMDDDLKKLLDEVKKTSKSLYEELKKMADEIKKDMKK